MVPHRMRCKKNLLKMNCFVCRSDKTNFHSGREPRRQHVTALTGHSRGTVKERKYIYKMPLCETAHPYKLASMQLRTKLRGSCPMGAHFLEGSFFASAEKTEHHRACADAEARSDMVRSWHCMCITCRCVAPQRLNGVHVESAPAHWLGA